MKWWTKVMIWSILAMVLAVATSCIMDARVNAQLREIAVDIDRFGMELLGLEEKAEVVIGEMKRVAGLILDAKAGENVDLVAELKLSYQKLESKYEGIQESIRRALAYKEAAKEKYAKFKAENDIPWWQYVLGIGIPLLTGGTTTGLLGRVKNKRVRETLEITREGLSFLVKALEKGATAKDVKVLAKEKAHPEIEAAVATMKAEKVDKVVQ